jgi:Flp pilus assembly CpaE family ATPase
LSGDPNQTEFTLIWTDSLASALHRLDLGGIDLILADLGLPDSDGLDTFDELRKKAPELPIIVLSAGDNEALALQTIQFGAQDYLVKSTCTADLLTRALRHALVRHRARTSQTRAEAQDAPARMAKIIGVVSGAGGAGATTVACVLAAELRHHTSQPTLLMDLDANPGQVAFLSGVDPQYTVLDALSCANAMDRSLWEGVVTRRPGNLDILSAARHCTAADLDIGGLLKIVTFAGDWYNWIVMDLGRLNKTSKRLLSCADEVMLVSTEDIPALHQCKQTIDLIDDLGIYFQMRLILNQREHGDHLSHQQIEQMFGVRIDAILPSAREDLYAAYLQKRLPSVTGPFRMALSKVARRIAGIRDEPPKRSLLSLSALRSRFQPKPRPDEDVIAS